MVNRGVPIRDPRDGTLKFPGHVQSDTRMEIIFNSSLDADEEDRLAVSLLSALSALLDHTSFAYTARIKTSPLKVFQQSHPATRTPATRAAVPPVPPPPSGTPRQSARK